MKYAVTVNTDARTVTVNYKGYIGVAKCCPTDQFDLNVGVELAVERAKTAKKMAELKAQYAASVKPTPQSMTVAELVHALEKKLSKNGIVVVGNGTAPNQTQWNWLRSIIGCETVDEVDTDAIEQAAYDEGYNDGYADAEMEYNEAEEEIYDRGYHDGEESAYKKGHSEGYNEGYSEGYEAAKEELREWLD